MKTLQTLSILFLQSCFSFNSFLSPSTCRHITSLQTSWKTRRRILVAVESSKSSSELSTPAFKNEFHDIQTFQLDVHPYFQSSNTNVYVEKTDVPTNIWKKIVPPVTNILDSYLNSNGPTTGVDVTTIFQDSRIGAKDLLQKCEIPTHLNGYDKALNHLEEALLVFQTIIIDSYKPSINNEKRISSMKFKARIKSSRGADGVTCPRWHVDHVPVRLVMALEGPGVCYLVPNEEKTFRKFSLSKEETTQTVNESQELDTKKANNAILKEYSDFTELQATAGEIVLLMGKLWEERLDECYGDRSHVVKNLDEVRLKAAVHKSPQIFPFQGRVLLTVDVVLDECQFDGMFDETSETEVK